MDSADSSHTMSQEDVPLTVSAVKMIDSLIFGYLTRRMYNKAVTALLEESPVLRDATRLHPPGQTGNVYIQINPTLHDKTLEYIVESFAECGRMDLTPELVEFGQRLRELAKDFSDITCIQGKVRMSENQNKLYGGRTGVGGGGGRRARSAFGISRAGGEHTNRRHHQHVPKSASVQPMEMPVIRVQHDILTSERYNTQYTTHEAYFQTDADVASNVTVVSEDDEAPAVANPSVTVNNIPPAGSSSSYRLRSNSHLTTTVPGTSATIGGSEATSTIHRSKNAMDDNQRFAAPSSDQHVSTYNEHTQQQQQQEQCIALDVSQTSVQSVSQENLSMISEEGSSRRKRQPCAYSQRVVDQLVQSANTLEARQQQQATENRSEERPMESTSQISIISNIDDMFGMLDVGNLESCFSDVLGRYDHALDNFPEPNTDSLMMDHSGMLMDSGLDQGRNEQQNAGSSSLDVPMCHQEDQYVIPSTPAPALSASSHASNSTSSTSSSSTSSSSTSAASSVNNSRRSSVDTNATAAAETSNLNRAPAASRKDDQPIVLGPRTRSVSKRPPKPLNERNVVRNAVLFEATNVPKPKPKPDAPAPAQAAEPTVTVKEFLTRAAAASKASTSKTTATAVATVSSAPQATAPTSATSATHAGSVAVDQRTQPIVAVSTGEGATVDTAGNNTDLDAEHITMNSLFGESASLPPPSPSPMTFMIANMEANLNRAKKDREEQRRRELEKDRERQREREKHMRQREKDRENSSRNGNSSRQSNRDRDRDGSGGSRRRNADRNNSGSRRGSLDDDQAPADRPSLSRRGSMDDSSDGSKQQRRGGGERNQRRGSVDQPRPQLERRDSRGGSARRRDDVDVTPDRFRERTGSGRSVSSRRDLSPTPTPRKNSTGERRRESVDTEESSQTPDEDLEKVKREERRKQKIEEQQARSRESIQRREEAIMRRKETEERERQERKEKKREEERKQREAAEAEEERERVRQEVIRRQEEEAQKTESDAEEQRREAERDRQAALREEREQAERKRIREENQRKKAEEAAERKKSEMEARKRKATDTAGGNAAKQQDTSQSHMESPSVRRKGRERNESSAASTISPRAPSITPIDVMDMIANEISSDADARSLPVSAGFITAQKKLMPSIRIPKKSGAASSVSPPMSQDVKPHVHEDVKPQIKLPRKSQSTRSAASSPSENRRPSPPDRPASQSTISQWVPAPKKPVFASQKKMPELTDSPEMVDATSPSPVIDEPASAALIDTDLEISNGIGHPGYQHDLLLHAKMHTARLGCVFQRINKDKDKGKGSPVSSRSPGYNVTSTPEKVKKMSADSSSSTATAVGTPSTPEEAISIAKKFLLADGDDSVADSGAEVHVAAVKKRKLDLGSIHSILNKVHKNKQTQ